MRFAFNDKGEIALIFGTSEARLALDILEGFGGVTEEDKEVLEEAKQTIRDFVDRKPPTIN